ncbi:MAG: hypothetical protein JNG89_10860, partial [Planctomycetaceae bacterium]|nr:hypothetical protein [Planctomycetaceae bacterium]
MKPSDFHLSKPHPRGEQRSLLAAVLLVSTLAGFATAQERPEPETGFRVPAIAFRDIKIVQQPGQVVEKGNLVLRDGRIESVGPDTLIPVDARIIDGTGLIAYPGFIDAATSSLIDPEALKPHDEDPPPDFRQNVLAGAPTQHRRGMTPEFMAQEHLLRTRELLEPYRMAGFTAAHVAPLRGIAGGQGCFLALGTGPLSDVLLQSPLHASSIFKLDPLPANGSVTDQYPITTMGAVAYLRQATLDSRHRSPVDGILVHLDGGEGTAFLADSPDEIDRALSFIEESGNPYGRQIIGGRDAHLRFDTLRERLLAPIVLRVDHGQEPKIETQSNSNELSQDFKSPVRVQQDALARWKERMTTAGKLHGRMKFGFTSTGCSGPEEFLKQLREIVAQGVPSDVVLSGLTQGGIHVVREEFDHKGLVPTSRAHVTVMNGPWEVTTTKVRYVVIGEELFEYNSDAESPKAEPPSAAPPPPIAGAWTVSIAAGDMKTTAATLTLTQDGDKLTGTFTSEAGDGKVISGRATVEKIEFVVAIGVGQRDVTLTFEGLHKSADDTLAGTMRSPFGAPTGWTAARVAAGEQPANPVALSLDAEEDAKPQASVVELPSELEADRLSAAGAKSDDLLLRNGTILTGTGETLAGYDLYIRDGRIAAIAPELPDQDGVTAIEVAGWFVMPGIIDTHSHIMIDGELNESSQSVTPEVRVKDVIRSDDAREYRALAAGVTTIRLLHGSANTIGGQDAVVKLRHGATAAEHVIEDAPQGIKFALGENPKGHERRFPATRMGVEATLKRSFYEALAYRREWQQYEEARRVAGDQPPNLPEPRRDLRLEALVDIIEGRSFIHCHGYRADEILMLLQTADELGIKVRSLQHALEGFKIAPEIAAHGASVSTFSDWWAF